jgi:hypothetical protein
MDSLKNKRACASHRIMVSVDKVEHYKKVIAQNCVDTYEYCEAKIALDSIIPEWLHNKAWLIAKEIKFMEQILTATGHEWHEALDEVLDEVRRNLDTLE